MEKFLSNGLHKDQQSALVSSDSASVGGNSVWSEKHNDTS